MAEYIVTVIESANWQELHNELVADGIEVLKLKATNTRNTHYNLTTEQATSLRNDPRVLAVDMLSQIRPRPTAIQDTDFSKTNSNWGLLRHTNSTNVYGTSTSDPGGTYDYVLDGTDVDVVIIDSGIQPDHPEFQDANGVSRVKQINWFHQSGVSGNQHSSHYSDTLGHGTHVAGTIAGKTYGWAKNANIYAINLIDWETYGLSIGDVFDVLKGWHDAKAGSRPTVVNCSWGVWGYIGISGNTAYLWDNDNVQIIADTPATGGSYRGVTHTVTNPITFRETYGLRGWDRGIKKNAIWTYPYAYASIDVDIKSCVDAGMMFCIAAGNNSNKLVNPTNQDYNNYFTFTNGEAKLNIVNDRIYYMRHGSPNFNGGTSATNIPGLSVGALDTTPLSSTHDKKTDWSCTGDAVNIYAAGDDIKSSIPTNSTSLKSGTSMASPQMAGMCALLMQAHPDWTPKQVTNWFIGNAQDKMHSTGESTDFTNNHSLLGGQARVAYFKMNGQKPFTISGS